MNHRSVLKLILPRVFHGGVELKVTMNLFKFVIVFATGILMINCQDQDLHFNGSVFNDCTVFPPDNYATVGVGGRLEVDCQHISIQLYYYYDGFSSYDEFEGLDYECYIFDESGTKLLKYYKKSADPKGSYKTGPLENNRSFNLILMFYKENNNSLCRKGEKTVTIDFAWTNLTCSEDRQLAIETGNTYKILADCSDSTVKLPGGGVDIELFDYTITWFRDCKVEERIFYSESHQETRRIVDIRNSSSFSHLVTYGRYSRYYHANICFTNRILYPAVEPVKNVYKYTIGSTAEIQCSVTWTTYMDVYWHFNGIEVCSIFQHYDKTTIGNYSCYRENIGRMKICSSSCNDRCICSENPEPVILTLRMENLTESDFGSYTCSIVSYIQTLSQNNLTLIKEDNSDHNTATTLIVLVTVMAVLLILLIAVTLLLKCLKTDLMHLWKKHCARFEKENRPYDVFLSYSPIMKNKEEIKKLLTELHEWMASNNYNVFDQRKCQAGDFHYNMIQDVVSQCHRMLIVLTPEYLTNETQLFDAHTGIIGCIKGDTKLIFILLPETQEYIKNKLQEKDSICLAFLMAMKQRRNSVILWKENQTEYLPSFFKKIEVAMPKLTRHSAELKRV